MHEFDFIARCTEGLSSQSEGLICGIGDDCAVFTGSQGRDWLISTDSFSEGIHFRREWMSAPEIGARCLAAAVSDIAAMGGRPRYVTIAIAVPPSISADDAVAVMAGITSAANTYQMAVIGGDTTASSHDLQLSLSVIGDIRHGAAIYRRGAKAGDVVYVTGTLGGAKTGLEFLKKEVTQHPSLNRFLRPVARVASGQWLNDTGCVTSMIDVSDGLLQDLGHVARASGAGLVLEADAIPCWSDHSEKASLETACTSGEEYELAFTVDGRRDAAFQRLLPAAQAQLGHPMTRVGTVVAGSGVRIRNRRGEDITPATGGFEHQIGRSE